MAGNRSHAHLAGHHPHIGRVSSHRSHQFMRQFLHVLFVHHVVSAPQIQAINENGNVFVALYLDGTGNGKGGTDGAPMMIAPLLVIFDFIQQFFVGGVITNGGDVIGVAMGCAQMLFGKEALSR